jgi:LEA14-like dessication related protein
MRIPILFFAAPLMMACSAADQAVDSVTPDAPDVTAEKASLRRISPKGIDLNVELGAYNPNSIDLEARAVTAKVILDGQHDLGNVEIPQEIDLPSKQQILLNVPVVVDWKDATIIASLVALKRNIPYTIKGSVNIGVELVKFDVPFDVNDVITEQQMREAVGVPPPPDGGSPAAEWPLSAR